MNQIEKKYIILGSLCALVLTLAVGYAAFSTVLKIKGTSTINSNWDVRITNIEKIENKGATDNEGSPSYDNTNGLSATFNTSFTTPGDYATYKIEITNNGSLDAILKNITMPENTNSDIIFYLNKDQNNEEIKDALKQNDTLFKSGETGNVGYVYVTVLYRDYEKQQTAQDKTANMTITFDFEQADGNGGTAGGNTLTIEDLRNTEVTTGDGLYKDEYENGRYVYRGANPNNYITFNNETWRIISVETDGTLKIIRDERLGDTMAWDTSSLKNWAGLSTLNAYLNTTYYDALSEEAKEKIDTHTWNIGVVDYKVDNMITNIDQEKSNTWTGNVALIGTTDYVKASTNKLCTSINQYYYNINLSCYNNSETHNWMYKPSYAWWTISASDYNIMLITIDGHLGSTFSEVSSVSVRPTLYLKSDITLSGEGTKSNPYTIVS